MKQPLVTIGVALYNDEKHVRRTLDCILAQSHQNLEILVSDDCSQDGTAEICREYVQKDSRISFMSQRRNLGSLANHELLFNLSSGEYFMWCNGHDCFDADYIESCVAALEADPELVLCYSKTVRHDYHDREQTELFDALDTRGLDLLQRFQAIFSAVVKNACMFYGVFRSEVLRKSKRHRRTIGGDLIFINEIGLLGHVLQLGGTTFHRYAMRPPSATDDGTDRWMELIVQPRGHKLETITPWLNMGYEYLTMIADSGLPAEQQGALLPAAVQMLNHVFGGQFRAETEQRLLQVDPSGVADPVGRNFYLTEIVHNLNRARFFYPDKESIDRALQRCLELARQADRQPSAPSTAAVPRAAQGVPERGESVQPGPPEARGEVRLSFVIIVLNGMPFLEYCINALYDIAHEIIVVEGAVQSCSFAANADGSSRDGTVQYLKNRPDPQGKLRLIQGLWPEKVHMQNAALELVTGNYVWLVDSDEIYKREDLATIKSLLEQTPSITQVNFIPDNFWKGVDTIFVSQQFFETGCHYRRLFKYVPGARFTSHRPPTLVWPGEEKSTEQMELIGGKVTRAMGVIIYHYSYVLDSQVQQKIELYNRYGWGEGWRIDLNEWYRECFLKWTPENAREIEARYPVWTGDRNSKTLPFSGTHPEDMRDYIQNARREAAAAGKGKGRFKIAGEHQEDLDLTKVGTDSDFAGSIAQIFREHRPKKIIETGTYHGEGTTRVITSTLKQQGIDATFFSIECNPQNHAIARENLRRSGLLPHVRLLNGISTPRAFLPTYQEIEKKYVRNLEQLDFDDVFIDHQEHQRALLYYKETDFSGVPEDLLGACLAEFDNRPDFVLLDSGGHMGNVEFNYLIQKLEGPCFVALDDIYHIKHHESFRQMQKDPRFKIVVSSREKFGFCIAYFTPQTPQRILWLRADSIGDNVLASSMLPHVKSKYPQASITVLCQQHIAELYEACPLVDQVITFELRQAHESDDYRMLIVKKLQGVGADLLLNSIYSRDPLYDLFAIGSGAPEKIALQGDTCNISEQERQETNRHYTRLIASPGELKPELERHRDFLRGLGIEAPPLGPVIWTSEADERFADDFFRQQGLAAERCIALFAGAQSMLRTYGHYGKALAGVCREGGYTLLALGAAADYDLNQLNLVEAQAPGINLSGKLTLRQTAALLRRCRLAVGAETGNAHIACAVGTPNVILVGGGHFGRFMPYTPLTSVACLPLACFFCNWGCRYGRSHCVKDVDPRVLEQAVRETLATGSDRIRIFAESSELWKPLPGEPAWGWRPELMGDYPHQVIEVGGAPSAAPRPATSQRPMPRISVVVPSYNYGCYLEACLDSILSQNYPNLELIVMDGGSTDDTVEILKRYQSRIAYWRSAPDDGQYSAIEEGLNRSTGEIMAWLNADDMFHPGVFSVVARIFMEHPEVEWLMGRPNSFDESGRQKHVCSFLPMNSRAKYLEDQELIQQEGTFWRRGLWQRSGAYIQKGLALAADLELWARFFRSARLYSVDIPIAGFRDHPLQKSKDKAGYTAEANRVLARERELFEAEQHPFSPPAPLPILIEGDRVIM
ncbi:glycosyltransferase [Geomonas oryzisoli]|uniref:Glycosyltransferase n=1 Tax=Geomonas oryzisoli TaxID=2847992 RepID=A0ABX8J971_9BACT|nr:glycosyltransferase [Geomonas oryzisoli]QWV93637.1 glycosyltransferase [Geomonas oryzisoli]